MRIGLLASVSEHLDSFWIEIVERWESRGHQVFLAAGNEGKSGRVEVLNGVGRRPSVRSLLGPAAVNRWVREHDLEVVLTNTATSSMIARLAPLTVPVVYFAHGFHWSRGRSASNLLWKSLEYSAVSRTRGFICLNDDDEKWLAGKVANDSVLRLPFGVGLDTSRFSYSPAPQGFEYCWIGEFSARKRPDHAVRVISRLRQLMPNARLKMLGKGDLFESAVRLAADLDLEDAIDFVGFADPVEYLSASAGLIHTATWEGLPRVTLEALAVGRRVYAYPVKGLGMLPNTYLSAQEEPDSLALAVWQASRSEVVPMTRARMSDVDYRTAADRIEHFLLRMKADTSKW